jgi:hypothetical protein
MKFLWNWGKQNYNGNSEFNDFVKCNRSYKWHDERKGRHGNAMCNREICIDPTFAKKIPNLEKVEKVKLSKIKTLVKIKRMLTCKFTSNTLKMDHIKH